MAGDVGPRPDRRGRGRRGRPAALGDELLLVDGPGRVHAPDLVVGADLAVLVEVHGPRGPDVVDVAARGDLGDRLRPFLGPDRRPGRVRHVPHRLFDGGGARIRGVLLLHGQPQLYG